MKPAFAIAGCAKCDVCGSDSTVFDSRPTEDHIRRRRRCVKCKHRWTTFEIRADHMQLDQQRRLDARKLNQMADELIRIAAEQGEQEAI